jgi:hypothetical protein
MDIPKEKEVLAEDIIAKAYEELDDSGEYFGGTIAEISCDEHQCGVWFHDDESANPEDVEFIARKLIDILEIDKPFYCSWAYTCSKPRIDEFGGGAFVVKRHYDTFWCEPVNTVREYARNYMGGE